MIRFPWSVAVVGLAGLACVAALASPAGAQLAAGVTISASPTDPDATTGAPRPDPGPVDLYVWLRCTEGDATTGDGATAAMFGLAGTLVPTAVVGANGFTVHGSLPDLVLFAPWAPDSFACTTGPVLAAVLTVQDPGGGGHMCLAPSDDGDPFVIDCADAPAQWGLDWIGFASDGAPPCLEMDTAGPGTSCFPPVGGVPVDEPVLPSTWGSAKALWR